MSEGGGARTSRYCSLLHSLPTMSCPFLPPVCLLCVDHDGSGGFQGTVSARAPETESARAEDRRENQTGGCNLSMRLSLALSLCSRRARRPLLARARTGALWASPSEHTRHARAVAPAARQRAHNTALSCPLCPLENRSGARARARTAPRRTLLLRSLEIGRHGCWLLVVCLFVLKEKEKEEEAKAS